MALESDDGCAVHGLPDPRKCEHCGAFMRRHARAVCHRCGWKRAWGDAAVTAWWALYEAATKGTMERLNVEVPRG